MMAKEKQKQDESLRINEAADWAKIRGQWAKERLETMRAHAENVFDPDDDLPLSRHMMLVVIGTFFVIFVVWANWATLDEVTRGDGKVIPSSEIQMVQHQEGGIVRDFLVKEGDNVTAGQVLMRLSDVGATSDLGSNQKRYLGLKAKSQRLQAEAEGQVTPQFSEDVMKGVPQSVTEELNAFKANQANVHSQTQVLDQQISQREQEVRELETRASDLRGVISLSRQEMDMIRPLVERGSAPKMELLQLERDMKERQTELNGVLTSLPRAKSAVEEAKSRIEELKSAARATAQTELATTQIEMGTIKETLSALSDRQKRTDIRSPVSGTIKDFKINTVGGVIKPGDDVVEIVPRDDQLLVEARVRPADIAFLYPGQQAIVKITAYDFSIYGGLKGEVVDISADTITNDKGESFYRVRVRTPEKNLKRKGEILPIIPGMVASVDILTGEKTVMEYIMKPFIKTLDNAMKER
ncbi:MAG: HlyD family type I secretion periplasmic adaptor subunit [Rhodospirillales bacterium]|nr:HlyD family type I secretion periplasmic adaptor subunit [Rhodospirillales bacterium]